MTEQFVRIADQAIAAYCAEYPTRATMLGNHAHDDRLEDPGRVASDRRRAELRRLLAALDGLDVVAVEREFVLHDSDESVDDGWIEET